MRRVPPTALGAPGPSPLGPSPLSSSRPALAERSAPRPAGAEDASLAAALRDVARELAGLRVGQAEATAELRAIRAALSGRDD